MTESIEERQKEFIKDIEKVCKHHKMSLVPVAQLKYSQDNGDYSIVAVNQIAEIQDA